MLRTLKAMADADVERFASGATLLAELEAAQADNIRLREALRLAVEEIGTDMHYVPAAIEEQILAALRPVS